MSCACENKRLSRELGRIRALAKAYAEMEGVTVAVLRNADGTYGFSTADTDTTSEIIEYITPY